MLGNLSSSIEENQNKIFIISILFLFFVFAYYYANNLNALGFYEMMNVAFDFDQSVFVKAIDGSYLSDITAVEAIWIKHPFVYLYSYFSAFLQFIGFTRFDSVAIVCILSVTTSLFLMWKTFLLITKNPLVSLLLLILLASTSSIVSIAVVFDSYSLLSTWTALAIYLFCRDFYQNKQTPAFILAFIYVMLSGITIYMLLLVFLVELSKGVNNTKNRKVEFKSECKRLLGLAVLSLLYGTIILIITYPEQFFILLTSPIDYLRAVLWAIIRPGEAASMFEVLYILFANGLLAPQPSLVPIPGGFSMLDLRSLQYSILEMSALFFIYLTFVIGLLSKNRIVFMPFLIFVILSFVFHIEYHDRGSLFLYASHFTFPIFVCLALGLKQIQSKATKIVTSVVIAVVIAITCWSSLNVLSYLNRHIEALI
ncbi:hypothetical protein [Glaciecola sp. MF2-115]|uniref:hypothetical protein n=1 Tax=Glaciecola sp. MF2-115 TaxID=3384827 RepID=UPI0039A39EBB